MPLLETIGSGAARGVGLFGKSSVKTVNYQAAGTTRVFSLAFAGGSTTPETGTRTVFGTPTTAIDESGSVYYATNFLQGGSGAEPANTNAFKINSMPFLAGLNYTFIAWYKGNQTAAVNPTWAVTVPVFGDPRGSVYMAFGLENGKIGIGSNGTVQGTTTVANNAWHMLTYVYKSNNFADGYVDNGNREITNKSMESSPTNNIADFIGIGYPYAGVQSPGRLSGIQVYSQALTQAQIQEIYAAEKPYYPG
jgi:hypothetical protein